MTPCGIEFLDFLQPTIATFYMVMPSKSAGAEYLCQIVKLHPLQKILQADLVIGVEFAHTVNHSSVIMLQAMQNG